MTRQVLLIVHGEHSDPGRVAAWLRANGYGIDLRCHARGDPLPDTLAAHAGAVIFGGPMSARDDHLPFIRAELDWLDVPLREQKPFLGICLGAQLLARKLGGTVAPHADGWYEIGFFPVRATAAGRGLFAPRQMVYQWHGDGFSLPAGAHLLAEGERFREQAFGYGAAIGVQFHPEVTADVMAQWTERVAHRMVLPGAQARDAHIAGMRRHNDAIERWFDGFMRHWLAPARAHGRSAAG